MKKTILSSILIAVLLVVVTACRSGSEEGKILPSEAAVKIRKELTEKRNTENLKTYEQYTTARKAITESQFDTIRTKNLPEKETLQLAEIMTWADKKNDAVKLYKKLYQGNDINAREAGKRLIDLTFPEVSADPQGYEDAIKEYRKKFAPSPQDVFGLYSPVALLSRYYNEKGDKENAIRVVMDEIHSLNTEAPYFSYRLLGGRYQAFLDLGQKEKIIKLLTEYKTKFSETAAKRNTTIPQDEKETQEYNRTTKTYEALANAMQAGLTRIQIIKAQAPTFHLTHFFNNEPVTF